MTEKLKFKQVGLNDWEKSGKEQKDFVKEAEKNSQALCEPKKFLLYDVYQDEDRIANIALRFNGDGSVFLWEFGIEEEKQGQGFRILVINQLSEVLAQAGVKRLITTCVYKNKGSLKFYRKVGFNVVCEEEFEDKGEKYHEIGLEKTL